MFIDVRQLTSTHETGAGTVHTLRGVDLQIEQGSFTSIMGPSGSGKTSLLRCLAGLNLPTSGQVAVGDVVVTGLDADARAILRRRSFGFVFQNFELLSALDAAENVELPLRLDSRAPSRRHTLQLLARVGMGDRAQHRPHELSGGQKQRVAIARALVAEPQVIFADEPTGSLDIVSARQVLILLRELAYAGNTIVMVTHDPVAAAVSDETVFLADGSLVGSLRRPTAGAIAARMTDLAEAV